MATVRLLGRLFQRGNTINHAVFRGVATKAKSRSFVRPLVVGTVTAAGAAVGYTTWQMYNQMSSQVSVTTVPTAHAASKIPDPQASVITQTKKHALYLTIHLAPRADHKKCAQTVARINKYVDTVCPADLRDEDNEILAGVGFSQQCLEKVHGKPRQNYIYRYRKGKHGDMPDTGGDIFIHAKSDEMSKLFELTQEILKQMPSGSVAKFEDIYSFVFRNGRDLSGFIDGTENPADDEHRTEVAVEKETGGSYVITQKWIHNLPLIASERDSTMEGWVGRTRDDSIELKKKPSTSHVARMTGGANFEQKKVFEIVRQSMPFGCVSGQAGLFFIGYSASPKNHDFMLDRMVGADKEGLNDDVMRLTTCVSGNYWYFPGVKQLEKMA